MFNIIPSHKRAEITDPKRFASDFAIRANVPGALPLFLHVAESAPLGDSELHGFRHWLTVLDNGLNLLQGIDHTGGVSNAFRNVVILFALFHDSRREDEGECKQHGKAAAMFLTKGLPASLKPLVDGLFGPDTVAMAAFACECHTIIDVPDSSPLLRVGEAHSPLFGLMCAEEAMVIGTCLDADRLDLARVGIRPHPHYLYSRTAKQAATAAINLR